MALFSMIYSSKKTINKLLFIQSIATFTQWIDIFLLFLIPSFLWNSTPQEIGLIATSFALSGLVLGPMIGVFIDRNNPVQIMFYSSIAKILLGVSLFFSQDVIVFSLLIILKGVSNTFYWPASSVVTNKLTEISNRNDYFSTFSFIDQFSKIITPLLIGFAIAYMDAKYIFLLSSFIILISIFTIKSINIHFESKDNGRTLKSAKADFLSGISSIKKLPIELIVSIVATIILSFSLSLYDPHIANFIKSLGYNENTYSFLITSTALGALTGALLVKKVLKNKQPFFLIKNGLTIFALSICILLISIATKLETSTIMIVWFMNGFGYELFLIGAAVNFQNLCPSGFLGRISTTLRSFQLLMLILAANIGGLSIDLYSSVTPFILSLLISSINLTFIIIFIKK